MTTKQNQSPPLLINAIHLLLFVPLMYALFVMSFYVTGGNCADYDDTCTLNGVLHDLIAENRWLNFSIATFCLTAFFLSRIINRKYQRTR